MEWVVLGGICVALIVFGFAKHIYYLAKNVWPVRRALDKPTKTLPAPGVVTISGIVSSIDDVDCPIRVTLEERGRIIQRGNIYWDQVGRRVETHPFAILLADNETRIVVEPGGDVHLRSSAKLTKWKFNEEVRKDERMRIGSLNTGERAVITGVLIEKREIEKADSEYRSLKGKVRIEYVLRPIPGEVLFIDSETMFEEISKRFGYVGWVRALGTIVAPTYYVRALWDAFVDRSANIFWGVVVGYGFIRFFMRLGHNDRRPWFDRPIHSKKLYYGADYLRREDFIR